MKLLKYILDFLVVITLFFFNFFKIILNIKKINSVDVTVIQNKGGFGYNFTTPDIMRNFYNKKKLFVWFFEPLRHNINIRHLFNFDFLILHLCLSVRINKKLFMFGSYEGNNSRISSNILIFLIKFLSKKYTKVYSENELYDQLNKQNISNQNLNEAWKDIYFRKVKKNNYKLKLQSDFLRDFNKLFKFKKNKKINLYLRNKGSRNITEFTRSGGDENTYHRTIKYLISKDYIILVTGDIKISENLKKKYPNSIFDSNDFKNKDKVSIYFSCISDYSIVEPGGGFWFGIYKKKLLKINAFPYGITLPGNKILFKNIYKKKNNLKMKKDWCLKNFKFKYQDSKYKITTNSSNQIYKFVKQYF